MSILVPRLIKDVWMAGFLNSILVVNQLLASLPFWMDFSGLAILDGFWWLDPRMNGWNELDYGWMSWSLPTSWMD